jgi:hypothetical protein
MRTPLLLAAILLLGLAACATPQGPGRSPGSGPINPPAVTGTYRATGTVLESPEHGPQLCFAVAESYPPQCSGIDIVGWDWATVEGAESANGTSWGSYTVTGTWDGERLTLTEPPAQPSDTGAGDMPDFSTPCPEPEGGWTVVDPTKADDRSFNDAVAAASARSDYAGLWIDQPIRGSLDESNADDPTNLILNVRVTGDVAAAERDLREIWGGALCVSRAERTEAELMAIQSEIGDQWETLRVTSSGIDSTTGTLHVQVVIDDGTIQAQFNEQYGPGVVLVESWLQPV